MRDDPNHYFDQIQNLRSQLASGQFIDHDTRALDYAGLARDGGEFGVQLLTLRRLFAGLEPEFLDTLEEPERRLLAESATGIRAALNTLQSQLYSTNVRNLDRHHVTQFTNQFQRVSSVASSIFVARFLDSEGEFARRSDALTRQVDVSLTDAKQQSDELRSRIQADLTQAAVSKNANFFHNEERRYGWTALGWGAACFVWFGVLIVGASILAFDAGFTGRYLADLKVYVPTMPDQWLVAQILASKVVVLGAFTYVGVVLVKGFMSALNAQVTNRHRAVSLDTYKFLLDGAQSDADRQAIIQRAAEAVFSLQETGLIRAVPGADGGLNTTINLPKVA